MTLLTLNAEQTRAAEYGYKNESGDFVSDPLLIIAGAGTGKTNTLAHRAAHLLVQGVRPENILLMTFSRRAASELVSRVKTIVAAKIKQQASKGAAHALTTMNFNFPWMGTFHSVANRVLRQFAHQFALPPHFTILDRGDAEDLMDQLRFELELVSRFQRFPKKATCINIYSRCVNSQQTVETVLKEDFPWCSDWSEELRLLFKSYSERKLEQSSLDYDDLLLYWYHLAEEKTVQQFFRRQFAHVLIDEYQDTNILQAGILTRLFKDGMGVTVVGDDAQSIYRFRSAEIENILTFPQQFDRPASVIKLEQNYRTTQPILDLANQLLAESEVGYRKRLRAVKKGGYKPFWVTVEDEQSQAEYIVEQVLAQREKGIDLKKQAVLFRSSHHSDRLEVELMRRDIPFVKYGGLKFLEAAHIKDLLAILRWAENPQHKLSGFRLLKILPGVGIKTATKALDYLQQHDFSFTALFEFSMPQAAQELWQPLLQSLIAINAEQQPWPSAMQLAVNAYLPILSFHYDDDFVRIADVEQLQQLAGQFESLQHFVSELTLDPPVSSGDLAGPPHKDDDFLILSTIHSAKGQEWHSVFVLNVADGNIPNEYACGNPKALEEERRLFNVAITRAKQDLHLIQPIKYWVPEQPKLGDKHVYGAKSRFFTDAFCQLMEKRFYSSQQAMAAEPMASYGAFEGLKSKIQNMW